MKSKTVHAFLIGIALIAAAIIFAAISGVTTNVGIQFACAAVGIFAALGGVFLILYGLLRYFGVNTGSF